MKKFLIVLALLLVPGLVRACPPAVGFSAGCAMRSYAQPVAFAQQSYGMQSFAFAQQQYVQPNLNVLAIPNFAVVPTRTVFVGGGFASASFAQASGGSFGGSAVVSQNRFSSIAVGSGGGSTVIRQGGLRGLLFGSVVRTR